MPRLASTPIDSRGDNDAAGTTTTRLRNGHGGRDIIAVSDPKPIAGPMPGESLADPLPPASRVWRRSRFSDPNTKGDPMARSLAERLRAHEQQKARLAEQEARLKADERKARTRRLIQAGGLVDKAGLLELEPNALYGALLSLRERTDDLEQVRQWAAVGGPAFAREARLAEEGKEPIVLAFPAALGRDATTVLRGAGFRFNKLLQHWEGLARFDEADTLATAYGGTVRRVANAGSPAPGSSPPLPAADRAAE
jgi:hypothetical protein